MRKSRVIAFVVAATLAVVAPAARAAAPPTLTGQTVSQQALLIQESPDRFACHDNPDGTIDITFAFYGGGATGPYPGGWTESGKIHLGKIDDPIAGVNRNIESFNTTFTFDSPAGQVSGSKHLAPSSTNDAGVFCSDFSIGYIYARTSYQATIVTRGGVFSDRDREGPTSIRIALGSRYSTTGPPTTRASRLRNKTSPRCSVHGCPVGRSQACRRTPSGPLLSPSTSRRR